MISKNDELYFRRKVSVEEASKAAEHIGLCHFTETSAAESFEAVDSVFRQLFRLVKSTSSVLEKACLKPENKILISKSSRRRRSINRMKQKFFDQYRKTPSSLKNVSNFSNGISEENFNEISAQSNETSEASKNCMSFSSKSNDLKSKCRSLITLNENSNEALFERNYNRLRFKTMPEIESNKNIMMISDAYLSTLSLRKNSNECDSSNSKNCIVQNLRSKSNELTNNTLSNKNQLFQEKELFYNRKRTTEYPQVLLENQVITNRIEDLNSHSKTNNFKPDSKRNKTNHTQLVLNMLKNAIKHDKVQKLSSEEKPARIHNKNGTKLLKNKVEPTCCDASKSSSLPNHYKKKHQRRPSLRDAVTEIIRMRRKSSIPVNLNIVGVI